MYTTFSFVSVVVAPILIIVPLYLLTTILFNLYFHPLRKIPGPKIFAGSRLPYVYSALSGHLATDFRALHERYGPVVRTAPNEISFTEPTAWKTIYGQRLSGYARFKKNYDTFHQNQSDLAHSLFISGDADHLRMRKVLAHAFSERSLREQEPIIQGHIDTLITNLHHQVSLGSQIVDLVDWFNYVAFDIVADLSFGEPFNTLNDNEYRSWVKILSKAWKVFTFVSAFKSIAPSGPILRFIVPTSLIRKQLENFNMILERVRERTKTERDRPDFISYMVKHNSGKSMTSTEIVSNASLLIAAGTETVATLLPAAAYLLAKNPEAMVRATSEVRSAFQNGTAIDIQSVSNLEYLSAVINEALRLFPPVPEGLPRVTPPEGQSICDRWIPGGTCVQMSPYAANLSSDNFTDPKSFIPDRWLCGDARFDSDKKHVLQPFSMGPRNCLGQSLALAETRLIIAKMLWNFDMKCQTSEDWMNQSSFMLWKKKPLMMKLTPVRNKLDRFMLASALQ